MVVSAIVLEMEDPNDFDQSQYGHATKYTDTKEAWEYPKLSIVALIVVSFGVRHMGEVYFAIVAQLIYWYCGHSGPDAMWNALAGVQAGRGKYKYVILPTLLTSYEAIDNYTQNKNFTYRTSMILGLYGLGFLLGKYRFL